MTGATVIRDASGNLTDLIEIFNSSVEMSSNNYSNNAIVDTQRNWSEYGTDFNCTIGTCKYGSQNSFQVS